jgi:hypothetical protein
LPRPLKLLELRKRQVVMKKLILLLAVAGLSVAATKSYDVTFTAPAVLGTTEVPALDFKH